MPAKKPETPAGTADSWASDPRYVIDPGAETPRYLTVHEALGRVLAELGPIGKTQRNEEQRFMFRGIDDVLNALNPLLGKYGVHYVPDVLERVPEHRTTKSGATMYEVNLHVRYTFFGPAGDSVSASGWGEGTDMGDKATNKAMTGAMKYVLFQVFAIATQEASESDSDRSSPDETTAGRQPQQGQPPATPATEAQVVGILDRLRPVMAALSDEYPEGWREARSQPGRPGTYSLQSLEEMATGDRAICTADSAAVMAELLSRAEESMLSGPCAICGRTRPRKQIVHGVVRCERVKDCEKHAAEGGDDHGDPEEEGEPAAEETAPADGPDGAGPFCGGDTALGCGEHVSDADLTYDDQGVAFHAACNPGLQ